jgi:hypothetical protein
VHIYFSKIVFLSKPEFNSQEIMGRFRQLSPDGSECGCMKAVILFTPGKWFVFLTLKTLIYDGTNGMKPLATEFVS